MSLSLKIKKFVFNRRFPMEIYVPKKKTSPIKQLNITSAWVGLELIIEDILERFQIDRNKCIEFGVEFGFSSVVFSNYFKKVIGVDIFIGDEHTDHKGNHFESTKNTLAQFDNIELFMSDYRDWIQKDTEYYDFAHVDIVHNYEDTYKCGLWAVKHSKCCIFHDTESFPEVKRAVFDIAKDCGKKVYNYPFCYGLGIIV